MAVINQIMSCIIDQHDWRAVVLAGVICALSTYTAFSLIGRAADAGAIARRSWISAAAIVLGSGIWSTHFIAMLGFRPHQGATYALWPTLNSIAVAILIAGLAFWFALNGSRRLRIACGALIGVGIGTMHYVGMTAIAGTGQMSYDARLVTLSVVCGLLLGAVALPLALSRLGVRGRWQAAAVLTLGICSLHFIGMAALQMAPPTGAVTTVGAVPAGLLTVAIASVTLLILSLGLGGAIVHEHLSKRSAHEAELARAEARFRELANATFEGILIHDQGVIRDANAALCELLGTPLSQLVGTEVTALSSNRFSDAIAAYLRGGDQAPLEVDLLDRAHNAIPVELLIRSNVRTASRARVIAVRDLRERKLAQDRIYHLAHHDVLTDLPNRKLFLDQLGQAISAASRNRTKLAVLCLDLDRFKHVNDLLGHWGGDELLRQTASRLLNVVRAGDTIARFGGDEFAIVMTSATAPSAAAALAERVVGDIASPFTLGEQQMFIGASIGIAMFPDDGTDGESLLRAADTALYRVKENGRNAYCFFEPAMDERKQQRTQLEHELRTALDEQQLLLHYQPQVDCRSGDITGYEALVRWQHPSRGLIPPVEFIPLAEETGLILPLGHWVLRTACTAAAAWPEPLTVAVNLSAAQFRQRDLGDEILAILQQTGLQGPRLEIEITESVLINDTPTTLATLTKLKEAGVRIALDDFGTGYSSLCYLQRFPLDKIKIDRSFVWEMEQSRESMSIVRAVIALGHSLQFTVTAEGVETPQQLAILQGERCDQVQGYLIGHPAPTPAHVDAAQVTMPTIA